MNLVKITNEALAAVGATGPDDFMAKLVSKLVDAQNGVKSANEALEAATKANGELATKFTNLEKEFATLKAQVGSAVPESKIIELAEAAGSKIAAKALGATGVTPPAPASAAAPAGDAQFETLCKSGEYEKAFAVAPEDVKGNFSDAKAFAAFKKAEANGQTSAQRQRR